MREIEREDIRDGNVIAFQFFINHELSVMTKGIVYGSFFYNCTYQNIKSVSLNSLIRNLKKQHNFVKMYYIGHVTRELDKEMKFLTNEKFIEYMTETPEEAGLIPLITFICIIVGSIIGIRKILN